MAKIEYHVGCGGVSGEIYAGTLRKIKSGTIWNTRSVVTDEAIVAVRDHMASKLPGGQGICKFTWKCADGKYITLALEIDPPEKDRATES